MGIYYTQQQNIKKCLITRTTSVEKSILKTLFLQKLSKMNEVKLKTVDTKREICNK